jgi:hypothetical protein
MPGRFVRPWSGAGSQHQVTNVNLRAAQESAAAAWRVLRSVEGREGKVLSEKNLAALKQVHDHVAAVLADAGHIACGTEKPTGAPNLPNQGTPDGSSQGKQNTPAASGDGSGSRHAARTLERRSN